MKRSALAKLKEVRWAKVENDPLEVAVVPSAGAEFATMQILGITSESVKRDFCKRVFVDFKNYTEDDGTPVKNTIDARLELLGWLPARAAINNELARAQEEIAEGEGSAASE